jgi:hypothetical protein
MISSSSSPYCDLLAIRDEVGLKIRLINFDAALLLNAQLMRKPKNGSCTSDIIAGGVRRGCVFVCLLRSVGIYSLAPILTEL